MKKNIKNFFYALLSLVLCISTTLSAKENSKKIIKKEGKRKHCIPCKPIKKKSSTIKKSDSKKDVPAKEQLKNDKRETLNNKEKKTDCIKTQGKKEEQESLDLSYLLSDIREAGRTYNVWLSLKEDPMPNVEVLKTFIKSFPEWPSIHEFKRKLERQLNYQMNEEELLQWFSDHAPVTIQGITLFSKTLLQKGYTSRGSQLIKKTWRESDASEKELDLFQKEFQEYLTTEDYQARVDRLLSKEKVEETKKTLGFLNKQLDWFPKPQRDLALMRIELLNNSKKKEELETLLENTKAIFKNDVGLLYEEIKWRRRIKDNKRLIEMLQSDEMIGLEKSDPTLFWGERNIMVRRMIEEGSFQTAFELLNHHQLSAGEHYVNAEWLASFLLIEYLNKPDAGYDRLYKLYQKVRMPVSLSRISYWMAIAAKKMKAPEQAVEWFKKTAKHAGTYYGQLSICALEDLGEKVPLVPMFVDDVFSADIKRRFEKRELVKAVRAVAALGAPPETVDLFFTHLSKQILDGEEYRLLTNLASKIAPPKTAIFLSRLALDKMIITKGSYPVLEQSFLDQTVNKFVINNPLFPHIVHAIIRRESAFDPHALSHAGAKGLMQVIDKTASQTISKLSFLCGNGSKDTRVYTEPLYNVAIGTFYIKEQLEKYNGSVVLALCAYNAGPEAVDNLFCTCIGNPLTQKINMQQWIELIPYGETRNYVMRVIESLMMYVERARQDGLPVPQMRITDIIKLGTLNS